MTSTPKDLENVLARRKITIERFCDGEGLTTQSQLDMWISSKVSEWIVSPKLLEQLKNHLLAPPTSPTPQATENSPEVPMTEDVEESQEISSSEASVEEKEEIEGQVKSTSKSKKNKN